MRDKSNATKNKTNEKTKTKRKTTGYKKKIEDSRICVHIKADTVANVE
jgi:hypothetical protein